MHGAGIADGVGRLAREEQPATKRRGERGGRVEAADRDPAVRAARPGSAPQSKTCASSIAAVTAPALVVIARARPPSAARRRASAVRYRAANASARRPATQPTSIVGGNGRGTHQVGTGARPR